MATEKIFNTRLMLKTATLEEWEKSTLGLKKGELAIATVAATAGNGLQEPVCMIKIGEDGVKTFKDLPWNFYAKAADVIAAAKSEDTLTEFIQDVLAAEGVASDDVVSALAGRMDAAESNINTLKSDLNTAETGLKAKMAAAEAAIEAIEGRFGADTVALEINAAINALNLAGTYEAKGEAAKVQTALNEYKNTNDAKILEHTNAISANTNAIAAIKDGAAMDSFADVEAALEGKEAAGAAAKALDDAKAYADSLAGNYDAKGAAAAAETAAKAYAKEYADSLAENYDAAGAAAQALTDAKAYTDGFTGGKTVAESINAVIANYTTTADMNAAIATAKGEAVAHANGLNTAMDERVQALEAIDHTHSFVEDELNLIKAGDVAKWNAAEQNAKDYAKEYADDLDEAMDARVLALEAKFGDGEGNVEAQIAAAVAAEAKLRDDADKALQEQVTANADAIAALDELVGDEKVSKQIEDAVKAEADRAKEIEGGLRTDVDAIMADYLKAADKEVLQTQINTIMNNPDTEGVINSINEFTQYIADHGAIAEGFRTDIDANAQAIEAAKVDAANQDAVVLAEAQKSITAKCNELMDYVDAKAVQGDWNQNDETAPDYIKNRPFYEMSGEKELVFEEEFVAENWVAKDGYSEYTLDVANFTEAAYDDNGNGTLVTDAMYEVHWGNEVYTIQCWLDTYAHILMSNGGYFDRTTPYSELTFKFINNHYRGHSMRVTTNGEAPSSVRIYKVTSPSALVQIDEKFIPDTIARAADVEAALEDLTGGKKVSEAINEAIEALKIGDYAKAADLTAAINQHNTDKAALEASIATKANDADLAAIAKTGSTDDLVQGELVLVFNCGGAV